MSDPRRRLPSVDALLTSLPFQRILERNPRGRVVEAIRRALAEVRDAVRGTGPGSVPGDPEAYATMAEEILAVWRRPSLRSVINATGVVLHTNLGRAPLSEAARGAMARAAEGYSNLEFDLEEGVRGSRYVHCVDLLKELTGCPDALVVNNNAAAVVLALNTLAAGRGVLVSRGELVEIGGGFRIPEMLARAGAVLVEVGTTNRTRVEDYRSAAEDAAASGGGGVACILKVHRSNFRISGFTEEANLAELAGLSREMGLTLIHDLGSGLLMDPDALGLPPEPMAPESLRAGAQTVAISGDKLLGGPQAGILLGEAEIIDAMRRNPLCRALRVDKTTLAGLEATLRHYIDPHEALREVPVLRMLSMPMEELEARCEVVMGQLEAASSFVRAAKGRGVVGGGTYPGVELPSWTLRVRTPHWAPGDLAARLRDRPLPVVARIEDEELVVDLRTVDPDQDTHVAEALREILLEQRPAVFLDRDGTIIREAEYLSDPEGVVLIPGAAEGLGLLRDAGFALVVVTNQSGIARGLFTVEDYRAVARRLDELLAAEGIVLDQARFCPHHPDSTGACDCRKPGTGMHRAAARDLGIDLQRSYFVGDRISDIVPALELGGEGILVRTGYGAWEEPQLDGRFHVANDLLGAVRWILQRGR